MSYATIKSAIKTHLEAITGIKNVYGYEKGLLDGYPSAIITLESLESEADSTNQNERKYTFKIKVYQELEADALGAETAETTMEALIDTIIKKFEDDWDLGGLCYKTRIKEIMGYSDRGNGMRVIEATLECYDTITINS